MNTENVFVCMGMMQEVSARSFGKRDVFKDVFLFTLFILTCMPSSACTDFPPTEIFTFLQVVISIFLL